MVMIMNVKQIKNNYLKKIYFNAGKSIMDSCFLYMKQYIDYKQLNSMYHYIHHASLHCNVVICDCFGAFATILCSRLSKELFYNETVITVLDPYFNEKVICQMYIPDKNISIVNTANNLAHRKAVNLYNTDCSKNSFKNLAVAMDFFKKANKYN